MTLVERIELATKKKGLTFKSLERKCGLGNGTIRRWETQSPRLDGLLKVANCLQMSLDSLVYGDSEMEAACNADPFPAPHENASSRFEVYCDGIPLTDSEADLIAMFQLLDEKGRETTFDFVTMLYEKISGKKTSVYSAYTDTNKPQKSAPASGSETKSGTA